MTYFGTRLSENISRREPEGYLICLNVPVARTGVQEYLPSELGLAAPDDHLIQVVRPEEEVFSPACIASFEGMPVTDDHPSAPEGVTAENIRRLQKGHAHNVRRAPAPDEDLLMADLIITDPTLIEEILHGKREISCGYNYVLAEEDGTYVQREIRGNHVAVVDAGRAGPRVSIRDQEPQGLTHADALPSRSPDPGLSDHSTQHIERSSRMKKKSLWRAKLMARMAKDGDVEGLAELITEMMEEPDPEALTAQPAEDPVVAAVVNSVAENLDPGSAAEAPVVVETPVDQPVIVDCGPEILSALREIIALLTPTADCKTTSADTTPGEEAAEAVETAVEAAETAAVMAENVSQAAAEAVEAAEAAPAEETDPVEELVAEILDAEEENPEPVPDEESVISGIIEPTETDEEEDPDLCSADALRAALAAFRPQLKRMAPEERQRFNADVAARMRQLTQAHADESRPNAYAAMRSAAARDRSDRSLGRRIMEKRNPNMKPAR